MPNAFEPQLKALNAQQLEELLEEVRQALAERRRLERENSTVQQIIDERNRARASKPNALLREQS